MATQRKTWAQLLHQARVAVTLALGGLLGIFALQNVANVELSFLIWSFESRRIVVIAVSLVVGLAIGWVMGHSARSNANEEPDYKDS